MGAATREGQIRGRLARGQPWNSRHISIGQRYHGRLRMDYGLLRHCSDHICRCVRVDVFGGGSAGSTSAYWPYRARVHREVLGQQCVKEKGTTIFHVSLRSPHFPNDFATFLRIPPQKPKNVMSFFSSRSLYCLLFSFDYINWFCRQFHRTAKCCSRCHIGHLSFCITAAYGVSSFC